MLAGSHQVVIDDFRSVSANGRKLWKGRQDKGHRALAAVFRQAVAGEADLPGKLAKVRALTTAADQALIVWAAEPVGQKLLSPVQNAVNKCDLAIFDYDATAARFPPGMLAGLPIAIDTSDSATNCTRIA